MIDIEKKELIKEKIIALREKLVIAQKDTEELQNLIGDDSTSEDTDFFQVTIAYTVRENEEQIRLDTVTIGSMLFRIEIVKSLLGVDVK